MLTQTHELFEATILTVGTDAELTQSLYASVGMRSWSSSTFHSDVYLTGARRSSVGPRILASSGSLAFVDFDRCPTEAIETTKYLTATFPSKVMVVAIGRKPTSLTILSAMRSGCSEFLAKPLQQHDLEVVFDRLESMFHAEPENLPAKGAILACMGAKGGVGTTSLAVHLATGLASVHEKRVLLIDAHPRLGHAAIYLGLDSDSHYFREVVNNLGRMDNELLKGFVARHASGLELLASPDGENSGAPPDAVSIARTLDFLRGEYDFIVVDCDRFQPGWMEALHQTGACLYVISTPDIAAVRDLSRVIDQISVMSYPAERLQILMNRYNEPHALPVDQVQKALDVPIVIKLPSDPGRMVLATNRGQTLRLERDGDLGAAMARWIDHVAGASATKSQRGKKDEKARPFWRQVIPTY